MSTESIETIIEEIWSSTCPWAVRPAVTRSRGGVSIIFTDGWAEVETEHEARQMVQHAANRIKGSRPRWKK